MYGAGAIIKGLSGEQPDSPDSVNKLLNNLKDLLLPEAKENLEDNTKKVKRVMERELEQGPFKVEAMVYKKKGKGLN